MRKQPIIRLRYRTGFARRGDCHDTHAPVRSNSVRRSGDRCRNGGTECSNDRVAGRPAGLVDHRRLGLPGHAPTRRRPVPGPGDVEPGARSDDHRQGRQRNPPTGDRTGAAARDLSASPRRRLGAGRRGHAGSDARADRRRYGSGRCRRGISAGAGTPLSGGSGRLRGCCRLAGTERQERVRH